MTSFYNAVSAPYRVFPDVDGEPLEDGFIYIGEAGSNPETNPITVYFDQALTIPALQPLRTIGGFISNSGTPANAYTERATCSITVRNKNGTLVYSNLNSVLNFDSSPSLDSVNDLVESDGLSGKFYLKSWHPGWQDTLAGPKGGHYVHATGATNTAPSVGVPVPVSTIGTGIQAGYYWSADGKEWVIDYDQGPLNPCQFGAYADGVTSDVTAFVDWLTFARGGVVLPYTYYFDGAVAYAGDNITIHAYGATFICDNIPSGFVFGTSATDSEPNWDGLVFRGGTFVNADETAVVDRGYIQLLGVQNFHISDMTLNHVSNGGILCRSGCRDGLIEKINIPSLSAYTTIRGIWLNGADASDYASNLVDNSSITRNATPVPVGGLRDITIRKCNIKIASYNIYLMNSQNTVIEDNDLDLLDGTLRNITVNTYSPHTKILNNRLRASALTSSKGILITQYAHDVKIKNNTFSGDYGLNVCIQAIFLADVEIEGNTFAVSNPVCISGEMGASGRVINNTFTVQEGDTKTPGDRCLRIYTIGAVEAGLSGYGDTATDNTGWLFSGNTLKQRNYGVQITQQASLDTGNEVGIDAVVVKDNHFYNWDGVNNSQEYPLYVGSLASPANTVKFLCDQNTTYPSNNGFEERNRFEDPVGAGEDISSTSQDADRGEGTWNIQVADGSGNLAGTSAAVGTYFRIKDLCFFQGNFTINSLAGVTGTNNVEILNLPYIAESTASVFWTLNVGFATGLAIGAGEALSGYVQPGQNELRLTKFDLATGTSNLTLNELSATGQVAFSGYFRIANLTPQ